MYRQTACKRQSHRCDFDLSIRASGHRFPDRNFGGSNTTRHPEIRLNACKTHEYRCTSLESRHTIPGTPGARSARQCASSCSPYASGCGSDHTATAKHPELIDEFAANDERYMDRSRL